MSTRSKKPDDPPPGRIIHTGDSLAMKFFGIRRVSGTDQIGPRRSPNCDLFRQAISFGHNRHCL